MINHNEERDIVTDISRISFNGVCHVRPNDRDSRDIIPLPVPDKLTGFTEFTKQCFWINNSYLKEIIKVSIA